jgi:hypothetical protein
VATGFDPVLEWKPGDRLRYFLNGEGLGGAEAISAFTPRQLALSPDD